MCVCQLWSLLPTVQQTFVHIVLQKATYAFWFRAVALATIGLSWLMRWCLRRSFGGSIRLNSIRSSEGTGFKPLMHILRVHTAQTWKKAFSWLFGMFYVFALHLNRGLPKIGVFSFWVLTTILVRYIKLYCVTSLCMSFCLTFTTHNWSVLFKMHVNYKNRSFWKPALLSGTWEMLASI